MRIDFTEVNSKVKLYHSVGRFDAAEKLLLSLLDEHGSVANIHNLLGVTYHQQSKFADAIIQFTKALKTNDAFIEAGLNLAATFCDLGKYDDAKSVFAEINAKHPPNKPQPDLILGRLANHHASCARLYEQSGFINEALTEYKKALSLYDKMPDVKIAVGKIYFRAGQYDRSLAEFQAFINQHPNEPQGYVWAGLSNWKLGHADVAENLWKKAVTAQDPSGVASALMKVLNEARSSI